MLVYTYFYNAPSPLGDIMYLINPWNCEEANITASMVCALTRKPRLQKRWSYKMVALLKVADKIIKI